MNFHVPAAKTVLIADFIVRADGNGDGDVKMSKLFVFPVHVLAAPFQPGSTGRFVFGIA